MMSPTTYTDNGSPVPPENMSVKELREWLKTFGKQHKEHFEKNQVRRSPNKSSAKKTPPMSVRDRIKDLQQQPDLSAVVSTPKPTSVSNENQCPSLQTPRKLDDSIHEDPALDIPIAKSKSSELPEAHSFQEDDLCLTFSAVSMAPSDETEEANGSFVDPSETKEDSFDMANLQYDYNPYSPPPVEEAYEEEEPHYTSNTVPADWSDMDPIDFDASIEASSGSDKEDDDDDGAFASPSATWPTGFERTGGDDNARDYLKNQSLSPFQGSWSDNDCDDDDCQGGGRNSARARRAEERRSLGLFSLETTFEDTESNFSLADAARGSVSLADPRPKTPSLSDFFMVDSSKKSSPKEHESPALTNQSMHDANLFQDKMMTAGALGLICDDKAPSSAEGDLESFFNRDQGTVSSGSVSEDSGKPSIAPNAVDEKLSKAFSNDTDNTAALTVSSTPEKREPVQARNYEESDDSKRQEAPSLNATTTPCKLEICETPTKKKDGSPKKKSPSSAFSAVMQKFGGSGSGKKAARKTRIEQQKEKLEEKWAEDRAVKHVKKTKWLIGRGSSIYKKRVVLEFDEKPKGEAALKPTRYMLG